ncbi:MAG: ATP-binding protein [Planctomycetaceae bacterium]|nr:ATP-binding protein [Planctomycetaceae bacterium]
MFSARAMESNAHFEHFEVTIPSDTVQGQAVQERIVRMLETLDYPPRDVFGVRLALEEAIVNAIKHGNGMDPEKNVRIECSISSERVTIEIEDQGEGFVPSEVPDPTDFENLEKPCGRGLMLMRSFMNRIDFNETGNRVTIEKIRGVDNPRDDDD